VNNFIILSKNILRLPPPPPQKKLTESFTDLEKLSDGGLDLGSAKFILPLKLPKKTTLA